MSVNIKSQIIDLYWFTTWIVLKVRIRISQIQYKLHLLQEHLLLLANQLNTTSYCSISPKTLLAL